MHPQSETHTQALGVHMHKQTIAHTDRSYQTHSDTCKCVCVCTNTHTPTNQTLVMKTQRMVDARRRREAAPMEKFGEQRIKWNMLFELLNY